MTYPSTPSYRSQGRKTLARAKAELESGNDQHLKYAALELRSVMECLTYDRTRA